MEETVKTDTPKGIHPDIWTAILKQQEQRGIQLDRLPLGAHIVLKTTNSTYVIKPEKGDWLIKGGNYFPEETCVTISGSTWGGSMIKSNWIGKDMFLEIWRHDGRPLLTSTIRQANIIFADGKRLPMW